MPIVAGRASLSEQGPRGGGQVSERPGPFPLCNGGRRPSPGETERKPPCGHVTRSAGSAAAILNGGGKRRWPSVTASLPAEGSGGAACPGTGPLAPTGATGEGGGERGLCPYGAGKRYDRPVLPSNKARGHPLRPGKGRVRRAPTVLFGSGSVPPPLTRSSAPAEPDCPCLMGEEKVQVLLPGAAIAKRDRNRPLRALPVRLWGAAAGRPGAGGSHGPGRMEGSGAPPASVGREAKPPVLHGWCPHGHGAGSKQRGSPALLTRGQPRKDSKRSLWTALVRKCRALRALKFQTLREDKKPVDTWHDFKSSPI